MAESIVASSPAACKTPHHSKARGMKKKRSESVQDLFLSSDGTFGTLTRSLAMKDWVYKVLSWICHLPPS